MNTPLLTILAKLISIPSTPDDISACHAIIQLIEQELAASNLYITKSTGSENPWLVACTQDTKEPDVLLAVHLDVVPAGAEHFVLRRDGDRLYGRGMYDMKFAAACFLQLAHDHSDALKTKNIGFLFSTDEEVGGPSIPLILELGWRPKLLFLPDGGDNWHVEEQAKGFLAGELIARGTTAHGSRPWEGSNALHRLMDALTLLRRYYPLQEAQHPTLSINELEGGEAVNQIADFAKGTFDFRAFGADEIETFRDRLAEVVDSAQLECTILHEAKPLRLDRASALLRPLFGVISDLTEKPVQFTRSYGATDARFFAEYDIPAVMIQPDGGGRHAENEWISHSSLEQYYQMLEQWLVHSDTVI